ncbi:SAM_USH1G_HARP domain-containing protein Sans [Leptinotarsa decemlineata]|uniref:SAM_USH1G_HARP domain-containing protein Sans n=1 Tax=Leptinotarsa decemlineata TaxID=7539 RepID=UPI003D30D1D2
MTTTRYHKAAKDGILEVLKETTKRDCNTRDEQGMTPTLYAAFYGNLDALRLLCGRGGNPDKSDIFGNTALHLAAAQGHKHIVTFLVNFGANIYATDVDDRTPQELAGINNRDDILRYIDGVHAKLEATDKKKAKALQDKAKKDAKKKMEKFKEGIMKREQKIEKLERRKSKDYRPSVISTLKSRITGGSTSNLAQETQDERRKTFSAIINGGSLTGKGNLSTVERKIRANKNRLGQNDDEFKVSEIEDGRVTVNSLKGIRKNSEVLLGGTLEGSSFKERGRLDGIFNEAEYINNYQPPSGRLMRSKSQPDFLQEMRNNSDNLLHQEPPSIFIRPEMGSIVIRKSITNNSFGRFHRNEESSVGSGESYGPRQMTDDELSESESSEDESPHGPLERFLTAFDLRDYLHKFIEQDIDLNTLLLLNENDLNALNLPIGPHRRLVIAINDRRAALENPGEVKDSML